MLEGADHFQNISVEVKSVQTQFSELMGQDFRQGATSLIQVESRLPLLGAESFVVEDVDYYSALARLSAQEVKPLYRNQLQEIEREIQQASKQLEAGEINAEREVLLQVILEKLGDFKRHQTVLLVLGDTDLPKLQITKTELMTQLRQVQDVPNSIEQAARVLTRDCCTAEEFTSTPSHIQLLGSHSFRSSIERPSARATEYRQPT